MELGHSVFTLLHPSFHPPQPGLWLQVVSMGNHPGAGFEQANSIPSREHQLHFTPVIPVLLHLLLECEYNFSVSSTFAPSHLSTA